MRYIIPILCLIVLCCRAATYAQRYPMTNYNMENGLSHSNVYRIFQDKRGFLWFCTDYGLCRFDGRSFRDYSGNKLLKSTVLSMSEDDHGNHFVSTFTNGIVMLTDSTTTKINIPYALKQTLYAASDRNRLWFIAEEEGQHLYELEGNKVHLVDIRNGKGKLTYMHFLQKHNDEIFFAANDGLYKVIDGEVKPILRDIVAENIKEFRVGKDGSYWIGLEGRILNVTNEKIINTYPLRRDQILCKMLCDSRGNIWISLCGDGMLLLHDNICEDISQRIGLGSIVINDMMEDSEGNIWLATYGAGVYRISTFDIMNYPFDKSQVNIFCNSVCSFSDNKLLIGTLGRVGIWENGKVKSIQFNLLKRNDYVYFAHFANETVYIGTPYGLIKKNIIKNTPDQFVSGAKAGAISIYKNDENHFWISGYQNLSYVHNGSAQDTFNSLRGRRIDAITRTRKGTFWFGTPKGILIQNGNKFDTLTVAGDPEMKITHDILEDSHGRIWAATEGGLVCIDSNGKYKVYRSENGLNHNRCNKLIEDKANTLWVGTLHGLNYIDLNTLTIRGYSVDIFPDDVLSLYCDDSNTVFVGSVNGLTSVRKQHISFDNSPPPAYITLVKTATRTLYMPGSVALPYNEKRLTIEFIGISMKNANAVEYRYRILNLDDNWHITTNNTLELPSLPSGSYTFILNTRKNKGIWGPDVQLNIFVATPFWRTTWFPVMLIALLAGAISFATYTRIKKSEARKRQQLLLLNKVAYLRQQALSALINPHFIFNCMNSIQDYLNSHDNDKANEYLGDFARLIRVTMEDAQHAFIPLSKELERIQLYLSLEQLRFGDELTYNIAIDNDINSDAVRIPNMILQPYIENAIWHGILPNHGVGHIEINFKRIAGLIHTEIRDNGIGIDNSRRAEDEGEGGHFGMRLTEERLQLLQKLSGQYYTVTVKPLKDSDGGTGTLVSIILPERPAENLDLDA